MTLVENFRQTTEIPFKCWRNKVAKKWKKASVSSEMPHKCQGRLDGTCDDP